MLSKTHKQNIGFEFDIELMNKYIQTESKRLNCRLRSTEILNIRK